MKTLADFLRALFLPKNGHLMLEGQESRGATQQALVLVEGSPAKQAIVDLVKETGFADAVSKEIGEPGPTESEDEFVRRGSAVFERHLRDALAKMK